MGSGKLKILLLAVLATVIGLVIACDTPLETIQPETELAPCESGAGYRYATYFYVLAPHLVHYQEYNDTLTITFSDENSYPKKNEFHCFHAVIDGSELARVDRIEKDGTLYFVFSDYLPPGPHRVTIYGAIYSVSG